jgi:hypothetical protein
MAMTIALAAIGGRGIGLPQRRPAPRAIMSRADDVCRSCPVEQPPVTADREEFFISRQRSR